MNQLAIIHQQRVLNKDLAVYGTFENPLFLAKDVATWIEHSATHMMLKSIDEEDKVRNIISTLGGPQEMWLLTEDGLYEVLMQSRKPIAKQFKKQVKSILKEIRTNGAYVHAGEDDDETIIMAKGLLAAQRAMERQKRENQALHKQIEADSPYTKFGKVVALSDSAVNIGTFAKMVYEKHGINIGRNKLIAWLRDKGYLIKQHGAERNLPKQRYIEQGWFRVRPAVVARTDGDIQTGTTLITGKGQIALTDILIKEFAQKAN
ncbi:phage antirepressor KilAC domain-containing protein [Solibacillus sp. FSL W8-0372]|uniref:phage antirepressor n=1 Tax=Solibacillus sp. FSL W8-0372 TaxID=2921713 RepID=UPI0030D25458